MWDLIYKFFGLEQYEILAAPVKTLAQNVQTFVNKSAILLILSIPVLYAIAHIQSRWKSIVGFRQAIDDLEEREERGTTTPMRGTTPTDRKRFYRQSKAMIWPEVFIGPILTGRSPFTIYRLMTLWQEENKTAWKAMTDK